MSFISLTFLYLFLPITLVAYYLLPRLFALPRNAKTTVLNLFLFAISIFVYAWGETFLVGVLLLSLVVNYCQALWADARFQKNKSLRVVVACTVLFNLGLLFFFKYSEFVGTMISDVLKHFGGEGFDVSKQHLPLGISFFSFQAMSYVIDVCRREVPSERSLLRFGVYVFLFPHLFAGPIVRYRDLAGQLGERTVSLDSFAGGLRRFIIGLSKKLLIAEPLAEVADAVFAVPHGQLSASAAWLGVACFTLRIYFDFSGYSDMAIGLAKLFGFTFQENFNYPYIAASITDFWRRWHISLSSWFRDYVYIPLGGSRAGAWRTYRNLMIVFLLCGLWHGANWTFILWGIWHGAFLIFERLGLGRMMNALGAVPKHTYTLIVVMLGWVLFRAETLAQAGGMFAALFGFGSGACNIWEVWTNKLYVVGPVAIVACMPVLPWLLAQRDALQARWNDGRAVVLESLLAPAGTIAMAALLLGISMQLAASTFTPFIYFRH